MLWGYNKTNIKEIADGERGFLKRLQESLYHRLKVQVKRKTRDRSRERAEKGFPQGVPQCTALQCSQSGHKAFRLCQFWVEPWNVFSISSRYSG